MHQKTSLLLGHAESALPVPPSSQEGLYIFQEQRWGTLPDSGCSASQITRFSQAHPFLSLLGLAQGQKASCCCPCAQTETSSPVRTGELAGGGGGRARANPTTWSIICCLGIQGRGGQWKQGSRHKEQWSVGRHWVAKGAMWCHLRPALRWGLVLGTHREDCSVHLFTIYIATLYQADDFLSLFSTFWREGRVGGR